MSRNCTIEGLYIPFSKDCKVIPDVGDGELIKRDPKALIKIEGIDFSYWECTEEKTLLGKKTCYCNNGDWDNCTTKAKKRRKHFRH